MFYKVRIKDYIRVPPSLFGKDVEKAVLERVKKKYEGFISKNLGIVIDVSKADDIKDGIIIPGDGAPYYESEFSLLTFRPELQETIIGNITDLAEFGAFISMGPIEGMIHISQTMDDFVSFSKDKVLVGKESKKSLKVNDDCQARIIAVSFKEVHNPKIGLTMRQEHLGKIEWVKGAEKKGEKAEGKEDKKEGKKEDKKEKKEKKKNSKEGGKK